MIFGLHVFGEVLEWLNRTVSKTVVPFTGYRGFESHPLRQFAFCCRPRVIYGEVLEWSNRHDWKSCVSFLDTEGSNPSLSASLRDRISL